MLDAVDGGRPIHTQPAQLVVPQGRIRSLEQPVFDERKEEESSPAKLKWPVIAERVADTANEGLRRVEVLEGLNGGGTGGVSQRAQGGFNRLVLVPTATGSRLEVMGQEGENVVRILNPWQEPIPLISTAHGEARNMPLLLLRVGGRYWSPHHGAEQVVTLLGGIVLSEGGDGFYDGYSVTDVFGSESRLPERLSELPVDSVDLRVNFMAVTGQFSFG